MSPRQAHPCTASVDPYPHRQAENYSQVQSDSRASVPCKFLSRYGGCQNSSCPYLHAVEDRVKKTPSQDFEVVEDEDRDCDDDFIRNISGASVYFNELGHVLKVLLPTDVSLACITGLAPVTTPETVLNVLRDLGFNVEVGCIRVSGQTATLGTKATVKVEDPLFAKELSARLKNRNSTLCATALPIDARRTNCRKVYISWHKATRSVWVNFGDDPPQGREVPVEGTGVGYSYNPVAWTITLSDVPSDATCGDVKEAIRSSYDKPRHVELGSTSYRAFDEEVGLHVRSRLEKHGPLENFYTAPASRGKRVKATAWFQDEADARSACSLNNTPLDILGEGRVTVSLVQSVKIKVLTTVYSALKSRIDETNQTWKKQHLALRVYPESTHRFTTLKVEGDNVKEVADANKMLREILSGVVLMNGEHVLWGPDLSGNGNAYKSLKLIEKDLQVVIIRDRSKRQLQFYGPLEMVREAVHRVTNIVGDESSSSYEIDLNPDQLTWTMHSGFKIIEQALGKNIAALNVVLRRITINGTRKQYEAALAVMDNECTIESGSPSDGLSEHDDCPICLCEADNPVQTSCKHTYCLGCFEECCKNAATTSGEKFHIKCQGDEGDCSVIFTLSEVKDHLSSFIFETILKLSFEDFVRRRPEVFRYCPTPDCDFIYRCTTASSSKPPAYTCSNCLEPLCTSCHERHGDYTCEEYKDIKSGGFKALEKLKRELNIKDCPKCTTPMEKTEGCNHMNCGGCGAHICWVCMAAFEKSGPCYAHMNKEHGGNGLEIRDLIA